MLHPSPSQEAFTNLTRANSFHGYPEGDTQVMESQVYRDFTASIVKSTTTTPKKAILRVQISPNGESTYNTIMPDNTPQTCIEGETGYIDLEKAYMPSSSPGALSTSSHVDELLDNAQTQQAVEHEFTKPTMPETPGLAGNKRNRNGEIVISSSTTKKTPGFTQIFGGHDKAQMLSATQMFHQTQAPSSPQPYEPRSDPVVTRPSPIIHNHASLSSPVYTMTSPVRPVHGRPSTAVEPRGSYMCLEESQKRRQQIREELISRAQYSDDANEADLEEEIDRELARYEQAKRRREMNEHAKQEWSMVRASSRPGSRPISRQNSSQQQPATIDLVTPAPNKALPVDLDALDDDMYQSDDDILLEDDPHDAQISDDEYDELGQEVLRSQPNNDDNHDEEAMRDDDNISQGADMKEAVPLNPTHVDEEREVEHESGDQRPEFATQHSTIADSQPGMHVARPLVSHQLAGASSIPSVVPGSQLGAEVTQGQAAAVASRFSLGPDTNGVSHGKETYMPSSPPSASPGLHAEISNVSDHQLVNARTIPDSDLPEDATSPNQRQLNNTGERESNGLLYSTARTHASGSGPSPQKNDATASPFKALASQQSKVYSQSPRTVAGVRHFADIAGAKSPPRGSVETDVDVDVDAIVSDVVTGDDQDFMKLVSTPSEKRRSKRRKISHEDSKGIPLTTVSNLSSNLQPATVEDEAQTKSSRKGGAAGKSVAFEEPLQDSPSKRNELRASTPPIDAIDKSTPESVKKREQAGATATSQLLSKRKLTPKKSLKTYGKNSKRSESDTQMPPVTAAARSPKAKKPPQHQKPRPRADAVEAGKDTAITIGETEFLEQNAKDQSADEDGTIRANASSETNNLMSTSICAPDRVFALFKGQPAGYWPATFLGANADGLTYRVKFDDGTITTLESQHVCRLEFAVGDAVRVDLQEMRNLWQVVGFGTVAKDRKETSAGTDIYGHATVKVQAKSSRKSATNENPSENDDESTATEVPVTALYLTRTMWPSFANRLSLPSLASVQETSRSGTPSTAGSLALAEISASRSGRTLIPTAKAVGSRASNLRDESISAPESPAALGLFSGMAFAISYGSNEGEKAGVTRQIRNNGGIILEQGFDELFSLPNLDDAAADSSAKKDSTEKTSVGLRLKSEYDNIGFVALIADRHSRRAKYVQALALSLPTLSGKWIFDSLNQSKNTSKRSTLPWPKYLLPAGESSYLGGAVRSRTMSYYQASEAELSKTINERDILLSEDGVLIVASKKSKSNWERRKAFAFLTLALGAAWVKRVSDLAEAKVIANSEPEKWKWVYVDGSVAEASNTLFVKGGSGGKKRKRGDEAVKIDDKAMWATNGKLRIVNDEFVVQSLILGALVD